MKEKWKEFKIAIRLVAYMTFIAIVIVTIIAFTLKYFVWLYDVLF